MEEETNGNVDENLENKKYKKNMTEYIDDAVENIKEFVKIFNEQK